MNENINLCEILKGHEGETFYSVALGAVKLYGVYGNKLAFLALEHNSICVEVNAAEIIIDLFPSKDQRDWNKWGKVPKTWSDIEPKEIDFNVEDKVYIIPNYDIEYYITDINKFGIKLFKNDRSWFSPNELIHVDSYNKDIPPIEKSALALLKIHQLIEVGYGGNVTNEEWKDITKLKWYFIPYINSTFKIVCSQNYDKKRHIAFHTEEQAKEFLSYPENVQLLKDYFMTK